MMHYELYLRFTDGTGHVERTARQEDLDSLDRQAWLLLTSSRVESVQVRPVSGRVAGFERSRGSYR